MLKKIRVLFANRILGKDIYIKTLDTPEKIDYEIYQVSGSIIYGTLRKI